MALPTNVSYGTVTGRFMLAYADSSDVDPQPDGVPANGFVIFTPSPVKLLNAGASPAPVTILPAPVIANLNDEGYIEGFAGDAGIRLVATDDVDLNPLDWSWSVDFRLTDEAGVAVNLPGFSFELPGNTTVDLTTVSPVPSADGTFFVVGPRGSAATIEVGTTTTGLPGTSASVVNTGDTSEAVFNFTIPRGTNIAIGSTTTGLPGTPATVTNSGTVADPVLNFSIPRGETGSLGNLAVGSPLSYSNNTITLNYNQLLVDGGTA